eukprot:9148470-Pyramimonas_sp.AAC.1
MADAPARIYGCRAARCREACRPRVLLAHGAPSLRHARDRLPGSTGGVGGGSPLQLGRRRRKTTTTTTTLDDVEKRRAR